MPAPLDCPAMECWQALFQDALPRDQRERYERHLEACAACRERLERPGEFGDALRRLARRVGDPTFAPADPTLAEVVERLLRDVERPDRISSFSRASTRLRAL